MAGGRWRVVVSEGWQAATAEAGEGRQRQWKQSPKVGSSDTNLNNEGEKKYFIDYNHNNYILNTICNNHILLKKKAKIN